MPLPPPPAAAFTSSGNPTGAGSDGSDDEGRTASPAALAAARAASLSPMVSITSGVGPTQARPASVTARAKAAFSDRNPYPGWTASAPAARAAATMASPSR